MMSGCKKKNELNLMLQTMSNDKGYLHPAVGSVVVEGSEL
jgi:hypothetical protein